MKLSQKLLGLAGVALADYACCPYDDYGLPDNGCVQVLPEKTPFAGANFERNDCKAWEFNADAIFDGNDKCGVNRGQCGFQRQFAWGAAGASAGATTALTTHLAQIGIDDSFELQFGMGTSLANLKDYDPVTNAAQDFATDYTGNFLGSRTKSDGWGIGRAPVLGAVCKLFVPVPPKHIVQVQVAGVHKDGDSVTMFPGTFKATSGQATALDGTVFCFSVVNPSEGDVNTNGVANGNVNGRGNGLRTDAFEPLNSLARQAGIGPVVNFGDYLVGTADTTAIDGANDENNQNGSNFDVVAHFSSAWCARNFGNSMIEEMQQQGDYNYNDNSYDITSDHAHNDIVEKRFADAPYGSTYDTTTTAGYMINTVNNGGNDSNLYRWPNQGAWAAYHSVITCAQYDVPADPTATPPVIGNGYPVYGTDARAYVMSVSAQDFRQGANAACTGLNYRFNVRQVGTAIENCGPGQLPDADNKRCTWNWNYDQSSSEPETFFDRTNNLAFETWTRKRRGVVTHANASPNALAANAPVLSNVNFAFTFNDGAGNAVTGGTLTADSSRVTITGNSGLLACDNMSPSAPYRDDFPDCFFGDEVHFNVEYTAPAPTDPRSRINSWLSTVVVTHP